MALRTLRKGFPLFIIAAAVVAVFAPARALATPAAPSDRPYFTDIGQFNYARVLLADGDYGGAAREFERLIEEFPLSGYLPEAQLRLAEAALKAGREREAASGLMLFLSNFPESPLAAEAAALLATARGRIEARAAQRPAPKDMPPVVELLPEETGMRAVQVMLFEGRTPEEVGLEFRRLREAGIDTVIARVFHNRGDRFYPLAARGAEAGVYFKTSHAPVVDDILRVFTDLAHGNGLRLFAWMTTRYADYGVEGRDDLRCRAYDMRLGRYSACKGLDLFNDEVLARLQAIYSDLAEYDIDGVLFQDDLVSRHNEGFGARAEAAFEDETGLEATPALMYAAGVEAGHVRYTPLFWRWASWKNGRLLDAASSLRDAVRRKRPGAKFALNLMYESVTDPPNALAWLSQDLRASREAGFDYYSIMAYHRQMEDELSMGPGDIRAMIERMVVDSSRVVGDPWRVLIKLQSVDWTTGEPLPASELYGLVSRIKGLGGVGLAIVPYRRDFPFRMLSSDPFAGDAPGAPSGR
jgi:biofilm PGA synthesis lipoprotein PgaB